MASNSNKKKDIWLGCRELTQVLYSSCMQRNEKNLHKNTLHDIAKRFTSISNKTWNNEAPVFSVLSVWCLSCRPSCEYLSHRKLKENSIVVIDVKTCISCLCLKLIRLHIVATTLKGFTCAFEQFRFDITSMWSASVRFAIFLQARSIAVNIMRAWMYF